MYSKYDQQDATLHSFNSSMIASGSSNGLTNTRCCRYSIVLLMMGGGYTWNM